jgi:hypothetical protein
VPWTTVPSAAPTGSTSGLSCLRVVVVRRLAKPKGEYAGTLRFAEILSAGRQARYRLPPQDARLQHLAGIPAATRLRHFGSVATGLHPRGIRVAPTPIPGATWLQHLGEGQPRRRNPLR